MIIKFSGSGLPEIRRVLKTDGLLFAPTFVHGEGTGLRLRVKLMELAGFHTYHKWNAEEFTAFIAEHGFKVTRQEALSGSISPLCYLTARKRKVRQLKKAATFIRTVG